MFKILIGSALKGGNSSQEALVVRSAAQDLENQLNDKSIGVKSVQGCLIHDLNPQELEILAVVEVADAAPKKKGE